MPYNQYMKMTVDIDEKALRHLMSVIGVKTKREAIDRAIRLADRIERKRQLLEKELTSEQLKNAVDPNYDVARMRDSDVPH